VGTNSVKLLVAEVRGVDVSPVLERSEQTRLGRGFYPSHVLDATAIADTARAVAEFSAVAKEHGAAPLRVLGTSAARDARNAADLARAVRELSGLPLEVITGEQEADFAFCGACTDPALASAPLLILDAGGGSTEFIVGRGGRRHFAHSYPLGSVRLLEGTRLDDPPTASQRAAARAGIRSFLEQQVRADVQAALAAAGGAGPVTFVGTGGAATILARMEQRMADFDRARIEATRLPRAAVCEWTERLWRLPLAARREVPGLPPKRADVILFGAAIFEAVMECFALPELRVSTRGLRFGALLGDTA
jgi:exopolyphosphatase/guanosine-5'-triphosphate,3'-diphosphate pyrophosphatase